MLGTLRKLTLAQSLCISPAEKLVDLEKVASILSVQLHECDNPEKSQAVWNLQVKPAVDII